MNNETPSLWKSLSAPWQEAVIEAWEAYCQGSFPIGAVIADAKGEIIARGRNAITVKGLSKEPLSQHFMAHAEANAYIKLGSTIKSSKNLESFVLYTTLEPCTMCSGITVISGIKNVHFLLPDPLGGASTLFQSSPHINITFSGPVHDRLGNIMTSIFTVVQTRIGLVIPSDEVMAEMGLLPGVLLGRQLAQDGSLEQFALTCAPANTVVDALAVRLS